MEIANSFCYLSNLLSNGGKYFDSVIAQIRTKGKFFKELLPLLTSKLSFLQQKIKRATNSKGAVEEDLSNPCRHGKIDKKMRIMTTSKDCF